MFLLFFILWIMFNGFVSGAHAVDVKKVQLPEYNIVFIVVNALRADHVGCYGYSRKLTPHMDKLAEDGLLFDRAVAQSFWTLPSLASLVTSQYVSTHLLNSRNESLGLWQKTLAEILKAHGYKTSAFTCGLDTVAKYGLDRGFDIYDVYSGKKPVGSFSDMIPGIIDNLERNKDKKFFLFLHSYDVHPPYQHIKSSDPAHSYAGALKALSLGYENLKHLKDGVLTLDQRQVPIGPDDVAYLVDCYDAGVSRADAFVGQVISVLKANRLYERTIIVLIADHGEELGDRGTFNRFENQSLYQEIIHVPFIVRYPGQDTSLKGRRISSLVGLVDVAPTMLDLLGISAQTYSFQGKSFASMILQAHNERIHSVMVSEVSGDKWAILNNDDWKLIHSPSGNELYNLSNDPFEERNVAQDKLAQQVFMMKDFISWREQHYQEQSAVNNSITLDSKLIDNLRKAGYW